MWRNYFVTAVRHLTRNRLYAAISIASLTVGFAVAVLVGIFVRHEFSYDRFLPDHERLYFARQMIYPPAHGAPWVSNETRIDVAEYLKADFPGVEAVTRLQPTERVVQVDGTLYPDANLFWADPNMLDVLKLRVVAGDRATALAAPDSMVLTQSTARKYFGVADPLGRTLATLGSGNPMDTGAVGQPHSYRVTAVLEDPPAETHLKAQLFTLTIPEALDDPPGPFGQEALTYVRLARGVSAESINRQLPAFVARHIPPAPMLGSRLGLQLAPIAELHLPKVKLDNPGEIAPMGDRMMVGAVISVGALILMTAVVNFVGLMTARASQRAVEIGVRKSVGARRLDLVLQFMAEAMVQAAVAFILALAMGELLGPALGRLLDRPLALDYVSDLRFLLILASAAVLIAIGAASYPSLVLSAFRPATALKGGIGSSVRSASVRQALVVLQFAVLVLLTIVIVTVWRQTGLALDRALRAGGDHVLMIRGRPICGTAFEERIRALPGVSGAACSSPVVFRNTGAESSASAANGQRFQIEMGPVEPGFFAFFGLRPLAGREFAAGRPADEPLVQNAYADNPPVLLNATAARMFGFATPAAAVDHSVRWDRLRVIFDNGFSPTLLHGQQSRVLGVVPDYAGTSRSAVRPMVYWVAPVEMTVLSVRVQGAAVPDVMRAINRFWRRDGRVLAPDIEFFDQNVRRAYRDVLTLGEIVTACAAIAMLLAAIGLFGLASYTTERRTKEFGIRKALGATAPDIARLLLWQFSKPVLLACVIAAPAGFFIMSWWLQGFADRVTLGPPTFLAVAVVAVAIAWITVLSHTWQVARTRPVAALRYE